MCVKHQSAYSEFDRKVLHDMYHNVRDFAKIFTYSIKNLLGYFHSSTVLVTHESSKKDTPVTIDDN